MTWIKPSVGLGGRYDSSKAEWYEISGSLGNYGILAHLSNSTVTVGSGYATAAEAQTAIDNIITSSVLEGS